MAAQDRDLPNQVVDWYEDWIFLFVAWCLTAPPHCVRRDRINDFWWALTNHSKVDRWKVCQAMDALGMLFGALGGTDVLSVSGTSLTERDDAAQDGGVEHPSRYLPDGRLPEDIDPRATVPTRAESPDEPREPATEEVESPPPNGAPRPDRPESPRTLFNPTGKAPPDDPSPDEGTPQDERQETAEKEATDALDTARTEALVSVDVPRPAARRLRAVARRLDLPEPLLVARAVDLLRDRIDEVSGENGGEGDPLRRYQAQVEFLSRHGTADLTVPDTDETSDRADETFEKNRMRSQSAVEGAGTQGDGWTGRVPFLDVRGN